MAAGPTPPRPEWVKSPRAWGESGFFHHRGTRAKDDRRAAPMDGPDDPRIFDARSNHPRGQWEAGKMSQLKRWPRESAPSQQ